MSTTSIVDAIKQGLKEGWIALDEPYEVLFEEDNFISRKQLLNTMGVSYSTGIITGALGSYAWRKSKVGQKVNKSISEYFTKLKKKWGR